MSDHTPGPWEVEFGTEGYFYVTHDDGLELPGTAENEAMLSAAPDLYEALEGCCKRLRACAAAGGNDPDMIDGLMEQFEAPLAKARGEA